MIEFLTQNPEVMFTANGGLKVLFNAPRSEAKGFDALPKDKDLVVTVKRYHKKRSLDANAYFWVLCDEVAKAIHSTKEEVYRRKIKESGYFEDIAIEEEKAEEAMQLWSKVGIGWFCERFVNCKIAKCAKIRRYYGSSVYNTEQMHRLIENIIDDCHELNISTLSEKEIKSLCESYNIE